MNRHETLAKISYYEWMIESMKLKPAHELWIRDQIEDLLATLPALRERESEQTLCGDCLRPDCYHLEQVRERV